MSRITHLFKTLVRYQNGVEVYREETERMAVLDYNANGSLVEISIIPNLTPKRAYLAGQEDFTIYYEGYDLCYSFELECWPDNGTIKRLSIKRNDTGVEYRYISDHQDRMF